MNEPLGKVEVERPLTKADVDDEKYDRYFQDLRANQNLVGGLLGGLAAAAVGAVLWAVLTQLTGYKFGIIAIFLGFLVGKAVLKIGKGVDIQYRILGAVLALLSCLAGDGLAVCLALAKYQGVGVWDAFAQAKSLGLVGFYQTVLDGQDLIFYAIAVYEGYRFSARKLTQAEYAKIREMA